MNHHPPKTVLFALVALGFLATAPPRPAAASPAGTRDARSYGTLPPGCDHLGQPGCDYFYPHSFKDNRTGGRPILFLLFDGAHLTSGDDNPVKGTSAVVGLQGYDQVDIPAFDPDPQRYQLPERITSRRDAIAAIAGFVAYYYAPFDILVVTERPPDTVPYTMAVIGGSVDVLGFQQGVLGISPMDCGDSDPRRTIPLISEEIHTLKGLALVIVHEAGHSFGLAHVDDENGIMYPAQATLDAYWSSGNVPDGQACDGSTHQDSLQVLSDNLSPRPAVADPKVEFVWPRDGAILDHLDLAVLQGSDDVVVWSVNLSMDGQPVATLAWPELYCHLANVPAGDHVLQAIASDPQDPNGQARTSTTTISITVLPACGQDCTNGLAAISQPCNRNSDCQSNLCVEDPSTKERFCSRTCAELDPCPVALATGDQQVVQSHCICDPLDPSCCMAEQEDCGDGRDNDCDGRIDCADDDCTGSTLCTGMENCDTSIDDDFDGLTNCDDPDCRQTETCGCVAEPEHCDDHEDNDCDGLIDCADPDCGADCQTTRAQTYCAIGTRVRPLGSSGHGTQSADGYQLDGCSVFGPTGRSAPMILLVSLLLGWMLMRRRRHGDRETTSTKNY